jgi:hypothetical protein
MAPTAGNVTESIANAIEAAGLRPLTMGQKAVVLGSLAVWLEKAREEGREEIRENVGGPVSGYLRRTP